MTDSRTLAFINLHAVLGAIPMLCALDSDASALVRDHRITLGIAVKNGPAGTLSFDGGQCVFSDSVNTAACDILLTFPTPEKFNGMIDGTVTPIPKKGLFKAGFLMGPFTRLTDRLSAYLRAEQKQLADPAFRRISTLLMFRLIARAVCCIGNEDRIGQASASYMTDGAVRIGAGDDIAFVIGVQDHRLTLSADPDSETVTARMQFADLATARALFDGEINAVAAVGDGSVRIGGMVSQVDNINRILDRVALYLL